MAKNKKKQQNIDEKDELKNSTSDAQVEDQIVDTELESNPADQSAAGSANHEQELSEMKDKYLRLLAEFENYKKRTFREKLDTISTAARVTVTAILPVLDDFDRAKQMSDDESTEEHFSEGVQLVYQKLKNVLQQKGLQTMESTNEVFDPELHEALTEIPAPSEDLKGKVIDTIEMGYKLNDIIIRHAKVVVGK